MSAKQEAVTRNPADLRIPEHLIAGGWLAPCAKESPDPGHEDEGYSCTTHNMQLEECQARQAHKFEHHRNHRCCLVPIMPKAALCDSPASICVRTSTRQRTGVTATSSGC